MNYLLKKSVKLFLENKLIFQEAPSAVPAQAEDRVESQTQFLRENYYNIDGMPEFPGPIEYKKNNGFLSEDLFVMWSLLHEFTSIKIPGSFQGSEEFLDLFNKTNLADLFGDIQVEDRARQVDVTGMVDGKLITVARPQMLDVGETNIDFAEINSQFDEPTQEMLDRFHLPSVRGISDKDLLNQKKEFLKKIATVIDRSIVLYGKLLTNFRNYSEYKSASEGYEKTRQEVEVKLSKLAKTSTSRYQGKAEQLKLAGSIPGDKETTAIELLNEDASFFDAIREKNIKFNNPRENIVVLFYILYKCGRFELSDLTDNQIIDSDFIQKTFDSDRRSPSNLPLYYSPGEYIGESSVPERWYLSGNSKLSTIQNPLYVPISLALLNIRQAALDMQSDQIDLPALEKILSKAELVPVMMGEVIKGEEAVAEKIKSPDKKETPKFMTLFEKKETNKWYTINYAEASNNGIYDGLNAIGIEITDKDKISIQNSNDHYYLKWEPQEKYWADLDYYPPVYIELKEGSYEVVHNKISPNDKDILNAGLSCTELTSFADAKLNKTNLPPNIIHFLTDNSTNRPAFQQTYGEFQEKHKEDFSLLYQNGVFVIEWKPKDPSVLNMNEGFTSPLRFMYATHEIQGRIESNWMLMNGSINLNIDVMNLNGEEEANEGTPQTTEQVEQTDAEATPEHLAAVAALDTGLNNDDLPANEFANLLAEVLKGTACIFHGDASESPTLADQILEELRGIDGFTNIAKVTPQKLIQLDKFIRDKATMQFKRLEKDRRYEVVFGKKENVKKEIEPFEIKLLDMPEAPKGTKYTPEIRETLARRQGQKDELGNIKYVLSMAQEIAISGGEVPDDMPGITIPGLGWNISKGMIISLMPVFKIFLSWFGGDISDDKSFNARLLTKKGSDLLRILKERKQIAHAKTSDSMVLPVTEKQFISAGHIKVPTNADNTPSLPISISVNGEVVPIEDDTPSTIKDYLTNLKKNPEIDAPLPPKEFFGTTFESFWKSKHPNDEIKTISVTIPPKSELKDLVYNDGDQPPV